jgi:phosphate transport system permease protein
MRLGTVGSAEVVEASVGLSLNRRGSDVRGGIFRLLLAIALLFSVSVLAVLLVQVVSDGWGVLSGRLGDFLANGNRSRASEAGVFQALRGSFWTGVIVVFVAFPIGIASGVYLEEYARPSRLTRFIDLNIRNLAGVPSIVYGILGFTILVGALEPLTGGKTTLSAGLTVAIVVLPIVIITSIEAMRAVPASIREAGFGVGATRWEVVRHQVLPYAAPGILTGTVLALARALGEAAPLLLVGAVEGRLGSDAGFFDLRQLKEGFTAMPVLISDWSKLPDPGFRANTAAAIVILLAVVLLANATAIILRNRYEKLRHA